MKKGERDGELIDLATEIADDAARAVLESELVRKAIDDDVWLDLDSLNAEQQEELAGVIRYLELRKLLNYHPINPRLVQILGIYVVDSRFFDSASLSLFVDFFRSFGGLTFDSGR